MTRRPTREETVEAIREAMFGPLATHEPLTRSYAAADAVLALLDREPKVIEDMADEAWAAHRPSKFIGAIAALRDADLRRLPLREYKELIEAARERAGDKP